MTIPNVPSSACLLRPQSIQARKVTARTELEQLDLFEVSWCEGAFDLPIFPDGSTVALPNLVIREIEQLWARN